MLRPLLSVIAAVPVRASFEDFGPFTTVRGISPDGHYVCGARWSGTTWFTAVWTGPHSTMESDKYGSAKAAVIATAVTNSGDAIAYRVSDGNISGYFWPVGKNLKPLPALPRMNQTWPRAISRNGSTIVGFSGDRKVNWAVTWKGLDAPKKLPFTGADRHNFGEALGISGNGKVVVGHIGDEQGHSPVVWRNSQVPIYLLKTPKGGAESFAWATNFDGSVVTGFMAESKNRRVPMIWTKAKGVTKLGLMPTRFNMGMGRAVADDGKTIVGMWGVGDGGVGFVWKPATGVQSAQAYFEASGLKQRLKGLRIISTLGVSADGKTFVGDFMDSQGRTHGYRISVEP